MHTMAPSRLVVSGLLVKVSGRNVETTDMKLFDVRACVVNTSGLAYNPVGVLNYWAILS